MSIGASGRQIGELLSILLREVVEGRVENTPESRGAFAEEALDGNKIAQG